MPDSRLMALRVLTRVLSDGKFLDEALSEVPVAERSWVHEVAAGTLRWRGRLDLIIDQLALKKRPTGAIRKSLEMAVYQLLNQPQVQPAWVVSETVEFVRSREGEAASRFANALLRKVADQLESWKSLPMPEGIKDEVLLQARWASLPEWMWRRLVKDHGMERARALVSQFLERPSTWVRSRSEVEKTEPGPIAQSYRLTEWWPVHQSEAYQAGDLFVQDLSSQQLIQEFSQQTKPGRILDLCAAPGGKSAGLAWNGWQVIATDRATGHESDSLGTQRRFELLKSTADRIRGPHPITVLPREEALAQSPFDAVWVDAPCTGTGVIRRHPEIRWLKSEKDLEVLKGIQKSLVREAAQAVRPQGWLMYSVCSVLREELDAALDLCAGADAAFRKVQQWDLGGVGDGFGAVLLQKVH